MLPRATCAENGMDAAGKDAKRRSFVRPSALREQIIGMFGVDARLTFERTFNVRPLSF